jgi:hypothetical protein
MCSVPKLVSVPVWVPVAAELNMWGVGACTHEKTLPWLLKWKQSAS